MTIPTHDGGGFHHESDSTIRTVVKHVGDTSVVNRPTTAPI